MLNDKQTALIDKVSRARGFKHFSISVEEGSKKGDNYLGNIYSVTVKENDHTKEICYILKCADTNLNVRNQFPINAVYIREVFIYQTVLPAFEAFQKKYSIKHPFKAFAKFFDGSTEDGNEFFLMENIKCFGFHMLDRKATMDDAHVSLVFTELAKFHSLSLAMKRLEPETYKHLEEHLYNYFKDYEGIKEPFYDNFRKKIEIALKVVQGNQRATEALKKCQEQYKRTLDETEEDEYHLVTIHGDAWCNNMMFKYDDQTNQTKPTSMCLLDWQISRLQSPVTDLFYFLFLSASKPILDNHQKYLDLYYQTIDENLQSAGCDTKSVFPYELFRVHLLKFAQTGVLIALGTLEVLLKSEKDAKSLSQMAENGNNIINELWKSEDLSDEYYERIKDIIIMAVDNNYL